MVAAVAGAWPSFGPGPVIGRPHPDSKLIQIQPLPAAPKSEKLPEWSSAGASAVCSNLMSEAPRTARFGSILNPHLRALRPARGDRPERSARRFRGRMSQQGLHAQSFRWPPGMAPDREDKEFDPRQSAAAILASAASENARSGGRLGRRTAPSGDLGSRQGGLPDWPLARRFGACPEAARRPDFDPSNRPAATYDRRALNAWGSRRDSVRGGYRLASEPPSRWSAVRR